MACEPVVQDGWLVLAGRSDLTSASVEPFGVTGTGRLLTVVAAAPVNLYQLGQVVNGVAHVAVALVSEGPMEATLEWETPFDAVVLHLDDANVPRVKVVIGLPVVLGNKGWQLDEYRNDVMAARGVDDRLLVVARVDLQSKGIRLWRDGQAVFVCQQEQPSGPTLTVLDAAGNPLYRLVSGHIDYSSAEPVAVRFGDTNIEIPTDQAPDNFVPDLRYGLRVLQPPQQ